MEQHLRQCGEGGAKRAKPIARICGPAFRTAAAAVVLGFAAIAVSAAAPKVGEPAPAFRATTLDGRGIGADELRGKVVLVHFWATWCPPCVVEMPALDRFYRDHRAQGFEVVAVSMDDEGDRAKVRDFSQRFAFPVAMKSAAEVGGFGRLWALPLSFLIDRAGVVRKTDWTGAEPIDSASLDRLVLPLLSNP